MRTSEEILKAYVKDYADERTRFIGYEEKCGEIIVSIDTGNYCSGETIRVTPLDLITFIYNNKI